MVLYVLTITQQTSWQDAAVAIANLTANTVQLIALAWIAAKLRPPNGRS